MLCQRCQKKIANVYFTKVINGKKSEIYLCEQCAGEQGHIGFVSPANIGNFLSGLVGKNMHSVAEPKPDVLACTQCGMRYEEFQQTGKLGCGNCYTVFEEQLKPVLKRLHGNCAHCGKAPVGWTEESKVARNPLEDLDHLKVQLNEAIKKEEYEKAAVLRDRIRDIETGGVHGG